MNADTLTKYDLVEALKALRHHVVLKDDLRGVADAIDAGAVHVPRYGWRFDVVRGPSGEILEIVATPFTLPTQ